MPACRGEVSYKGQALVAQDIEHLRDALAEAGEPGREAFIPAASPGCICNGAENFHYPTYEAYLEAVTGAMAEEYKAIVDAGFILQLDCPDMPMAAHTSFWAVKHMQEMGFERYIQLHVDALNQSIADLPADRMRDRHQDQRRRASPPDRPADRPLRRDRRPRARHPWHRLRLRHLRGLRNGRSRRGLDELAALGQGAAEASGRLWSRAARA
jgi:hypothetical protein